VKDGPSATNFSGLETYTVVTPLNLVDIFALSLHGALPISTLTVSDPSLGSLSTATSGSVTSSYNAVMGVWTASGPIAAVNSLLAGVTFTPAPNVNASFSIATDVSDGALSVAGNKSVTGIAV